MKINSPILLIEINNFEFIFFVVNYNSENKFQIIYKESLPIKGSLNKKISNLEMIFSIIKNKIYFTEQKFNAVFKEVILIIDDLNCSLINFSGFKKLNGSQLNKNDVTYILNSLKSKINEIEDKKTILHIFNSKYILDNNNVDNLPIGLFGNLYSQELSFFLINSNDHKNLCNLFLKCNLKVRKILSKSFIEGSILVNDNIGFETFAKVEISQDYSKILFFENAALKYVENFEFGTNLILNDISKITSLNKETIKTILVSPDFCNEIKTQDEIIDQKFFKNQNFRKIKKKLIYDIANARIEEIVELIFSKNINFFDFKKKIKIPIFMNIHEKFIISCFKKDYISAFSKNSESVVKVLEDIEAEKLCETALTIVQYGWKKEAVPVVQEKKSVIARIFHKIFN
tara:strand:- start:156 stop:1358 length:1203 start_codon:yes stop_codon:yes gene_type:complete